MVTAGGGVGRAGDGRRARGGRTRGEERAGGRTRGDERAGGRTRGEERIDGPGQAGDGQAVVARPMRADARRNYERLVETAREAFTERGVEASLDDIARRAGVGPGTLYRHFPTREVLLAAVYRSDIEDLAARADEMAEAHAPWEALSQFLRLQLEYTKYKRGLGAAVKTMLGADSETLAWCRDTLRGALGRLLTRAQRDGAVRADVEAADVLRLVHGVGIASESAPEQADRLLSLVLDGLRPRA